MPCPPVRPAAPASRGRRPWVLRANAPRADQPVARPPASGRVRLRQTTRAPSAPHAAAPAARRGAARPTHYAHGRGNWPTPAVARFWPRRPPPRVRPRAGWARCDRHPHATTSSWRWPPHALARQHPTRGHNAPRWRATHPSRPVRARAGPGHRRATRPRRPGNARRAAADVYRPHPPPCVAGWPATLSARCRPAARGRPRCGWCRGRCRRRGGRGWQMGRQSRWSCNKPDRQTVIGGQVRHPWPRHPPAHPAPPSSAPRPPPARRSIPACRCRSHGLAG